MDTEGVQDRKTYEAGKVFIKEGEEGYTAFLIQSGSVRVYTTVGEKEIDLAELGPGSIVGEVALILDEPRGASVQTLEPTVVATITRDDFELRLRKSDKAVRGILKLLSQRLKYQNRDMVRKSQKADSVDDTAMALMHNFSQNMSMERREAFMKEITPHMNNLIKALKAFKG